MSSTVPCLTDEQAERLRDDLAGWTVDAVEEVIGERAARALSREQITPALMAARDAGTDRHALLTRLFVLGDALSDVELGRALPGLGADGSYRAGLVDAGEAGAAATGATARAGASTAAIELSPHASADGDAQVDWWVASDPREAITGRAVADDHVLGVGGASTMLASVTVRQQVGRVLDLGTGCGIQALHASRHASTVVATDISHRALAYARLTEALNRPALGDAAWDLRHGSLLEPVDGEHFDLIVSNPPFVITPPGAPRFEYRDGGLEGDAVVATLIREAGAHLNPGGIAQFLGNWEIRGTWTDRLEQWLDQSPVPLDAWVIQRDALDAAEYAETWLRDAGITPERDAARFRAAYESYLRAFDDSGVEAIGFGAVLLRRPSNGTPTLRRLEEHEGALPSPLGPHLAASLAAHDWLAQTSDDDLLATAFTVAPDVTKETYGRPLLADPEHILLRQGGALGRSIKADTALAGLVGASDGELTAGQIAHALAALLDVPAAAMVGGLAPALRDLVRDGFLLRPAG
ncbi:methyltransferase [Demequina sp. NBRC 110051]|uniref:DUF7059 domain-containing protein n=1 Tax=Demequina sp. NBRC 110051 TaxID=1570340 RepID=UPI000A0244C3|nr:methyltransferase [Demequina sp. NBRC 110051]